MRPASSSYRFAVTVKYPEAIHQPSTFDLNYDVPRQRIRNSHTRKRAFTLGDLGRSYCVAEVFKPSSARVVNSHLVRVRDELSRRGSVRSGSWLRLGR